MIDPADVSPHYPLNCINNVFSGYTHRTLSPQFCLRKFEVRFKLGANNEVKLNTKE